MRNLILHVASEVVPSFMFIGIVVLMLCMPDLMVEAVRLVVR